MTGMVLERTTKHHPDHPRLPAQGGVVYARLRTCHHTGNLGADMTTLNKNILASILVLLILFVSSQIGDAIRSGLGKIGNDNNVSQSGRWIVIQSFNDGWAIMDTTDGQICVRTRDLSTEASCSKRA